MAPQDSFIEEEEDTWYDLSPARGVALTVHCSLGNESLVPKADDLTAPSVSKSSIFRIGTFDHVLVATRCDSPLACWLKLLLRPRLTNNGAIGVPVLF